MMGKLENNNMESRFKQLAESYEFEYQPQDWTALEAMLDADETTRRPFLLYFTIGFLSLAIITMAVLYANNSISLNTGVDKSTSINVGSRSDETIETKVNSQVVKPIQNVSDEVNPVINPISKTENRNEVNPKSVRKSAIIKEKSPAKKPSSDNLGRQASTTIDSKKSIEVEVINSIPVYKVKTPSEIPVSYTHLTLPTICSV